VGVPGTSERSSGRVLLARYGLYLHRGFQTPYRAPRAARVPAHPCDAPSRNAGWQLRFWPNTPIIFSRAVGIGQVPHPLGARVACISQPS